MMQSWDDLRYFLALQRHRKLVSAGRSLNVDYTTVGRRVRELESVLKAKLFEKKESGYEVTEVGESLIDYAETIEKTILGIEASVARDSATIQGSVRISSPEYIGNYFLAGHFPYFLKKHPGLEVELLSNKNEVELTRRNVDIMITTERPSSERLVVKKLASFSIGLFSSSEYIEKNAKLESVDDLSDHKLIVCEKDNFLKQVIDNGVMNYCEKIPFKSCNLVAQYKAMQSGYGLCLLPCFMQSEHKDLIRVLDNEVAINKTLWLVVNEDMRNIGRVKATSEFISNTLEENKSLLL